jgi:hypothetical protein
LEGARLHGSDLSVAKNVADAELRGAFADRNTRSPDRFDPERAGVRVQREDDTR